MNLVAGTYTIGPATGALSLHTKREGFGALVGHDLVIAVTRWTGTVVVDADDITRSTVEVVVDATSLEVQSGSGGAAPLLEINKREIRKNIDKVLRTAKFPEITFRSTAVAPRTDGAAFAVRGNLTLVGSTRPIALAVSVADADTTSATVTTTIVQSEWGIKPYSAMFGALKVRDPVEVRAEVALS